MIKNSCLRWLAVIAAMLLLLVPMAYGQDAAELTEAQTPDVPDTLSGWDMGWEAGLNVSQAAYSNWSTGGVNSYNLNSFSRIRIMYQKDRFAYDFQVRTRYGQARVQEEGRRKTDDRIRIRNRFLYDLSQEDSEFKLFGNLNFETQFTEGFDYGGGDEGQDVLISDFFSPAYFNQIVGLAYFPEDEFSVDAGLGLRQTVIRDTTLSERYGLDPGQQFRLESGVALGVNFETEIMEDIDYTVSIESFTNVFRPMRDTYVAFGNQLTGRVNDYVNVQFQLDIVHDPDFSRRLQLAQSFSAGVTVNIY